LHRVWALLLLLLVLLGLLVQRSKISTTSLALFGDHDNRKPDTLK